LVGFNVRLARENEFPFIAAILRRNVDLNTERDLICAATLITNLNIITSAHCMENEIVTGIIIMVGSVDLASNPKYYPAWWIEFDQWATIRLIHNHYNTNDISIIRVCVY
jgi:V8-like Glu-specific endopeptidase